MQPTSDRCRQCRGLFEPLSQQATQIAMGPWFIRDPQMPFRPGCSYDVLLKQIRSGKITRSTIVRGPTTHQFWLLARHVPGVAHLLGICHRCGAEVDPAARACRACKETFATPLHRNELGLMYPRVRDAAQAHRKLARRLAQIARETAADSAAADTAAALEQSGEIPTPPQFDTSAPSAHADQASGGAAAARTRPDGPPDPLADLLRLEPPDFIPESRSRLMPRWLAPYGSDPIMLFVFAVTGIAIALAAVVIYLAIR